MPSQRINSYNLELMLATNLNTMESSFLALSTKVISADTAIQTSQIDGDKISSNFQYNSGRERTDP
ncbi:hypothetical protein A2J04_26965 [Rhodococcus sp. EPR-279]|nr:hypothetical protein A2J02_26855 [Rhodococcus sp. EPR-147]KZF02837.1 hypothetical protein A2J04_26965 [Rhodococcus sp. EPR-279]